MTTFPDPAAYWNDEGGPRWVQAQAGLDHMLAPITEALLEACDALPGERVVDVGCGCGTTTALLAERVGPTGRVLGLDVSRPMLDAAEERCRGAHPHVTLLHADAARAPLAEGETDLLTSRFGVMFFPEPVAAFAHLRTALAPEGRVVFACWQGPDENDWHSFPVEALPEIEMPRGNPGDPGPFAFADPARIHDVLGGAGFADVRVEPRRLPLSLGETAEEALATSALVGPLARALGMAPEEDRPRLLDRVRTHFEARWEGLALEASVWLVHARR